MRQASPRRVPDSSESYHTNDPFLSALSPRSRCSEADDTENEEELRPLRSILWNSVRSPRQRSRPFSPSLPSPRTPTSRRPPDPTEKPSPLADHTSSSRMAVNTYDGLVPRQRTHIEPLGAEQHVSSPISNLKESLWDPVVLACTKSVEVLEVLDKLVSSGDLCACIRSSDPTHTVSYIRSCESKQIVLLVDENEAIAMLQAVQTALLAPQSPLLVVLDERETALRYLRAGARDFVLAHPILPEVLRMRIDSLHRELWLHQCLDECSRPIRTPSRMPDRSLSPRSVTESSSYGLAAVVGSSNAMMGPLRNALATIEDLLNTNDDATGQTDARLQLVDVLHSLTSSELHRPTPLQIARVTEMDPFFKSWLLSEDFSGPRALLPPADEPAGRRTSWIEAETSGEEALKLASLEFNVFEFTEEEMERLVLRIYASLGLVETFKISISKLRTFVHRVRQGYRQNPYHNWLHAVDVTQCIYALLVSGEASVFLTRLDILAVITAALCHDLEHPGLTNNFQIHAQTALALIYNDTAVLENHHASRTFGILRRPDCNILENLSHRDFVECRRCIVAAILATDMAQHFTLSDKFATRLATGSLSCNSVEDRYLLVQALLHAADLSNSVRPLSIMDLWTKCLVREFYHQGDLEKEMCIPLSPFMDRDTPDMEKMEVNFLEFIVTPFFRTLFMALPNTETCIEHALHNQKEWLERLHTRTLQETSPAA